MAEELPDTGRVRKQLEFYEAEVRRLEQQLAQTNLGFNKQVADLEAHVKVLTLQVEATAKEEQPTKVKDADKDLTDEINQQAHLVSSKEQMIAVLETENKHLKQEIQRLEQLETHRKPEIVKITPEVELSALQRICYDIKSIQVPIKNKVQFFHPLLVKMSREDVVDKFFTYDVVIEDFKDENVIFILKALQENAPDSYILKEKLLRSELPFTGRINTTLEDSNKLRDNLLSIHGT